MFGDQLGMGLSQVLTNDMYWQQQQAQNQYNTLLGLRQGVGIAIQQPQTDPNERLLVLLCE